MLEYTVGDVFRTELPFSENGKNAKPRWFIYLGKSCMGTTPVFLYIATTTTQADKYHADDILYTFCQGECGFTHDCILTYMDIKNYIDASLFESYKPIKISQVPKNILTQIWKKLKKIHKIKRQIKDDIRDSFRLVGIPT